ncbi:hypothetical protein BBF96_13860 [Anoxybacter fermentans]|uniref:Major facilitator superfamily (MFS) profile domain-containing protein n=1 Tax=Anoxybacter fermentans TaxID=1323375 RepID=A0A3S9T188_9FIRM|nr:hypothetical protein BBF96_13860 [Anoxybacter fermentans]
MTSILDFPTGNISDLKGRKKTSLIGLLTFGIGLIIYGSGQKFWHFALALGMMGLGCAFISGAITAWYMSELELINKKEESKKVFALSNGFSYLLSAIAGIIATFLLIYSLRLPFWIAGTTACLVVIVCSLFMNENYGEKDVRYINFLNKTWNTFIKNKRIKLFTFIQIISDIGFIYFVLTWQPYLISFGLKPNWLGIMFTIMMISISITSFVLSRFIN